MHCCRLPSIPNTELRFVYISHLACWSRTGANCSHQCCHETAYHDALICILFPLLFPPTLDRSHDVSPRIQDISDAGAGSHPNAPHEAHISQSVRCLCCRCSSGVLPCSVVLDSPTSDRPRFLFRRGFLGHNSCHCGHKPVRWDGLGVQRWEEFNGRSICFPGPYVEGTDPYGRLLVAVNAQRWQMY